jgi:hypothetical protein
MLRLSACLLTLAVTAAVVGLTATAADKPAGITIDRDKRLIIIDAKVAPRKIDDPRYKEIYPIEVVACWPFPKGQKAHETVVTIDVKPSAVHKALEDLGLKPGKPAYGGAEEKKPPAGEGPEVKILLEVPTADGGTRRIAIERVLVDKKTLKPLKNLKWRFTGSIKTKPDPDKPDEVYAADNSGTLIAIFPVTNQTVFQTDLTMKEEKYVKLETDKKLLPKEGTPVKLIIEVPPAK